MHPDLPHLLHVLRTHSVVRLTGPGAVGLASAWAEGIRPTLAVGELPTDGDRLWFHDAPGSRSLADTAVAAVFLLHRSLQVVLTGRAVDGGHPGRGITMHVEGEADGVRPATQPLLGQVSERRLQEAADGGDLALALALRDALGTDVHAWIELHRLLQGGRAGEVEARAIELAGEADGRAAVLVEMAMATFVDSHLDRAESYARAALQTAEGRVEKDARYVLARILARRRPGTPVPLPGSVHLQAAAARLPAMRHLLDEVPGRLGRYTRADLGDTPDTGGWVALGQSRWAAYNVLRTSPTERGALAWLPGGYLLEAVVTALEALQQGNRKRTRDILRDTADALRQSESPAALSWTVLRGHLAASEDDRAEVAWCARRVLHGFPEMRVHPAVAEAGLAPLAQSRDPWCRQTWLRALVRMADAPGVEAMLAEQPVRPLVVGDYVLEEPLASGGCGTVWRGRNVLVDEPVALKVLHRREPALVRLFQEEIDVVAAFDHPAIVSVYDVLVVDAVAARQSGGSVVEGQLALVMEYVGGGTLADCLGELDALSVRAVLLGLLDALAYAHAHGVVHQDLKPLNVLLDGHGGVRLSDFGLSALQPEQVFGTPSYMAPEQFRVGAPTAAADLYALGCLAWALVSGLPPYMGPPDRLARAHAEAPIPTLAPVVAVPYGLDDWLVRCLAKSPSGRFRSAAEAAEALSTLDWEVLCPPDTPRVSMPPQATATTFVLDTLLDLPEAEAQSTREATHTLTLRDVFEDRASWRPRIPSRRLLRSGDPPLLFRQGAQERLWVALMQTVAGRGKRLPVTGPGRRRLLAWLRRRAAMAGLQPSVDEEEGALCLLDADGPVPRGRRWLRLPDERGGVELPAASIGDVWWILVSRMKLSLRLAARAAVRSVGRVDIALSLLEGWFEHPGARMGPKGLVTLGAPDANNPPATAAWTHLLATLEGADLRLVEHLVLGRGLHRTTVERLRVELGSTLDIARWWCALGERYRVPVELQRAVRARMEPERRRATHARLAAMREAEEALFDRAMASGRTEDLLALGEHFLGPKGGGVDFEAFEVGLNVRLLPAPAVRALIEALRAPTLQVDAQPADLLRVATGLIAGERRFIGPTRAQLVRAMELVFEPTLPLPVRASLLKIVVEGAETRGLRSEAQRVCGRALAPGSGLNGAFPHLLAYLDTRWRPAPVAEARLAALDDGGPFGFAVRIDRADLLLRRRAYDEVVAYLEAGPLDRIELRYNLMCGLVGSGRLVEAADIAWNLAPELLAEASRYLGFGTLTVVLLGRPDLPDALWDVFLDGCEPVGDPILRRLSVDALPLVEASGRREKLRAHLERC